MRRITIEDALLSCRPRWPRRGTWWIIIFSLALKVAGGGAYAASAPALPEEIRQIFEKPLYRNSVWGLHVVDLQTGQVIYDLNSERPFLIGSVRKLFSVGLALEALSPAHTFRTPVHRRGEIDSAGVLAGDLILVASGDLAMGGRTNPDGSFAITNLDHNEANALGNAELTKPDPLAGYDALASRVAAAGIKRITGEVIIDDRLFEPFNFRGQFNVRPIFVNDDVVDVIINPTAVGKSASVDWRPKSAAFDVQSTLMTGPAGASFDLSVEPERPSCIGLKPCVGEVTGTLPVDFVPPLTGRFPVIRTFRIVEPSNYARTVLIEALGRAGVSVAASAVRPNPVQGLPPKNSYEQTTRVAELVSSPYRDYVKLILKVSYNIGADTSLVLFGLTKGASTMAGALAAERETLATQFGIRVSDLHFIDGSGGGDTTATSPAVIKLLEEYSHRTTFPDFFDSLPRLGVDGSLVFVNDFEKDATLAGAKGRVHAKTGTYVAGTSEGMTLKAQALAGYIEAKSGRRLAFMLAVNDVPITGINDVLAVFQDQGTISAILWKGQ
jgi:D-alanyl-D-alanine carboxypeptidase/D-alanyl-D-alanine-endopeptidase (penicillin-binding protein 4)